MNKIRKWLIHKMGGIVREDEWCTFKSDYWKEQSVSTSLYIPRESYNEKTVPDIERELVNKLCQELLEKELLSFYDSHKADVYGDYWVTCQANMLTFKNGRQKYHMLPRLSDVFERRRQNECRK